MTGKVRLARVAAPVVLCATAAAVSGCAIQLPSSTPSEAPIVVATRTVTAAPIPTHHGHQDVTIDRCAPDSNGKASAHVAVTNTGKTAATYTIAVAFHAGNDNLGQRTVNLPALQPGQTAALDLASSSNAGKDLRCDLTEHTRTPA